MGTLGIVIQDDSVCLPVVRDFQIIEESAYDAMFAASAAGPLQSTVAGRKLDVSTDGEAGIDWANVGSPTTSVNLSSTTTNLVNTVTTYTGNTKQTGDSFARIGATGSGLTSLATAASISALNDPTAAAVADAVWDELLSGHVVSGSSGEALSAAGTAGDPWTTALPGAYGAGTAGKIVGDNINAPIATVDTVVDGIASSVAALNDVSSADVNAACDTAISDAALATAANLVTVDTVVDGIQTDLSNATDGLGAIKADTAAILIDTGTTIPAQIVSEVNAVQSDIAALNDISAASVNAEVVDALNTDTYAEPGQGVPAATTSLAAKINYLYKFLRNKKTQTATDLKVFDDAGTTVDHKSTVSDNGTTFTKGEIVSGP